MKECHDYDDIIGLPHHRSTVHPPMARKDRAAQFAPFAALTGHEGAVKETARLTSQRIELAEDAIKALDEQIQGLRACIRAQPLIEVTYFVPDAHKEGGAYVTVVGRLKTVDSVYRRLVLTDERVIPVEEIVEILGIEN